MASIKIPLVVEYEDGRTVDAVAGQRDMAAFEGESFGCSSQVAYETKPMVLVRYLAWSALKRKGEVNQSYAAWDKTVDEVTAAEGDDEEANPTPREA